MSKKNIPSKQIEALYDEIRQIIEEARNTVYRTANFAMVQAYWNVGRLIVEQEQKGKERAKYGEELIRQLSEQLTSEYGRGFTATNLKYMRQFYSTFEKSHALRDELTWTHYRLLLKVEEKEAREFYLQEAIECNWSTRSLDRQINNLYYQRMVMSKNSKEVKKEAIRKAQRQEARDIIKDPYVLEFLDLKDLILGRMNWNKLL